MKREKISNPLTVVGIFAGIAEIAGTSVITFLTPNLQQIFIWYVMLFPILLVLLFFITWNFNPSVLYSPSDYQNEDNFIKIVTKAYRNFDEIQAMLTNIGKEVRDNSDESIEKTIDEKLDRIRRKLEETQNDYTKLTNITLSSSPEKEIMRILVNEGDISFNELLDKLNITEVSLTRALERLRNINLISTQYENKILMIKRLFNVSFRTTNK